MDIGKISTREIMPNLEMTITVGGPFRWRTRVAIWLIRVAGCVLTVPVDIRIAPKPFEPKRPEDFIA